MEDMMEKFAARLTLTTEEQKVVVIDDREGLSLKTSKVFLVGKLLSYKPVVKDRFKRHMMHLWHPKARVSVVELDKGGLWLYDGALLLLAEGWSMKVPLDLDEEECNISSVVRPLGMKMHRLGEPPVDLTLTVVNQKDKSDASYDLRLFGFDLNVPPTDDYEVLNTTGLKCTGGTSETSIGDKGLAPHGSQIVKDFCGPRFGKFDIGSDPFNLLPIIE
ncbi:hypothetical protein ACFX19_038319 [Malus domestica]